MKHLSTAGIALFGLLIIGCGTPAATGQSVSASAQSPAAKAIGPGPYPSHPPTCQPKPPHCHAADGSTDAALPCP